MQALIINARKKDNGHASGFEQRRHPSGLEARIELLGDDGSVTVLKEKIALLPGEVLYL